MIDTSIIEYTDDKILAKVIGDEKITKLAEVFNVKPIVEIGSEEVIKALPNEVLAPLVSEEEIYKVKEIMNAEKVVAEGKAMPVEVVELQDKLKRVEDLNIILVAKNTDLETKVVVVEETKTANSNLITKVNRLEGALREAKRSNDFDEMKKSGVSATIIDSFKSEMLSMSSDKFANFKTKLIQEAVVGSPNNIVVQSKDPVGRVLTSVEIGAGLSLSDIEKYAPKNYNK